MIYKRNKITRRFWIQRGFAALGDGLITLLTLGWYDGDMTITVAIKTLKYGMNQNTLKPLD